MLRGELDALHDAGVITRNPMGKWGIQIWTTQDGKELWIDTYPVGEHNVDMDVLTYALLKYVKQQNLWIDTKIGVKLYSYEDESVQAIGDDLISAVVSYVTLNEITRTDELMVEEPKPLDDTVALERLLEQVAEQGEKLKSLNVFVKDRMYHELMDIQDRLEAIDALGIERKLAEQLEKQNELMLRIGRVESAVGGMRMSDILARVERFENTVLNTIDRHQLDPTSYPAPAPPERWRPENGDTYYYFPDESSTEPIGLTFHGDSYISMFRYYDNNCFPTREAAKAERARRERIKE